MEKVIGIEKHAGKVRKCTYFFSYLQFAYSAFSAGGPKEQFAGIPPGLHFGSSSDVVGEVEGVVTEVVVGILVVLEWQIEFSLQFDS